MTDGRYRGKFWLNIRGKRIGTISAVKKGNGLLLRIAKSLSMNYFKKRLMWPSVQDFVERTYSLVEQEQLRSGLAIKNLNT